MNIKLNIREAVDEPSHGDIVRGKTPDSLYLYIELGGAKAVVLDLRNKLNPNSSITYHHELKKHYEVVVQSKGYDIIVENSR